MYCCNSNKTYYICALNLKIIAQGLIKLSNFVAH